MIYYFGVYVVGVVLLENVLVAADVQCEHAHSPSRFKLHKYRAAVFCTTGVPRVRGLQIVKLLLVLPWRLTM